MPSNVEFLGIIHNSLKFVGDKPKTPLKVNLLSDDVQKWVNIGISGDGMYII